MDSVFKPDFLKGKNALVTGYINIYLSYLINITKTII